MADRTVELYSALYSALIANAGLVALLPSASAVYTYEAIAGSVAPYVVLGAEQTATDALAGDLVDAQEHTVTCHVWAEATATQSAALICQKIAAAVRAALHEQLFTLSGGLLANLRCEFQQTLPDPDGISMHGILRFRAVTNL